MSFVSFTVPQGPAPQESYFAPLAGLGPSPGTELNFALVPYHPVRAGRGHHQGAGAAASTRLLAACCPASASWGICTECGLGRAARDEIPGLLDVYRQILAAG